MGLFKKNKGWKIEEVVGVSIVNTRAVAGASSFLPSAAMGMDEEEYGPLATLANIVAEELGWEWNTHKVFDVMDLCYALMGESPAQPHNKKKLASYGATFDEVSKKCFWEMFAGNTEGELLVHPYKWVRRLASL